MPQPLLEFWYSALASQWGIAVTVSDPKAAMQKLYQARTAAGDEDLKVISLHPSPYQPESELWLVKRVREKDNANGSGQPGQVLDIDVG